MDCMVIDTTVASSAPDAPTEEAEEGQAPTTSPTSQGSFVRAFSKQNVHMESAIKSLDHLNEQVLQFIFSPSHNIRHADHDISAKDRETLKTSMILMRHLLVDAQTKFRKMVDDNQRLAARIDGSIHAANQEVNILRAELVETNRRLNAIGDKTHDSTNGGDNLAIGEGKQMHRRSLPAIQSREDVCELKRLRDENAALHGEVTEFRRLKATDAHTADWKLEFIQTKQELSRNKEAVHALKADRKRLKAEKVEMLGQMKQLYVTLEDKEGELRDFIRNYEQRMKDSEDNIRQLVEEKEASERDKWEILKRAQAAAVQCVELKAECDVKEHRIADMEQRLAELQERSRSYSQLNKTDTTLSSHSILKCSTPDHSPSGDELPPYQELPLSLDRAVSLNSSIPNLHSSASPASISQASSTHKLSSSNRLSSSSICPTTGSLEHLKPLAEEERCPGDDLADSGCGGGGGVYVTISNDATATAASPGVLSCSSSSGGSGGAGRGGVGVAAMTENVNVNNVQPRKKMVRNNSAALKSPGTFSKLFGGSGKSRMRTSIAVTDNMVEEHLESSTPRISMLTQDNYQEKLQILDASKALPVNRWKANHVLAWLEIEMSMPSYGGRCAANVKSGKVLLGLSDSELDSALGLTSSLHRRKLRLAIEEYRDPSSVQFPKACSLEHTWLAHRWVGDCGLEQYRDAAAKQLLDGRLLNVLTRKDLEKHLGVHRKFHQASLLHGVELLRRVNFDKEVLMKRRAECENSDTDPIVWSSQRVVKWLESIDLHEYVDNIVDAGIHGALLVLEPTFSADIFATALGIPPSKSYVRRHLNTELDTIVRPARSSGHQSRRAALDANNGNKKRSSSSSSIGKGFTRSYRGGSANSEGGDGARGSGKRLSFRGSLGRALGRKCKPEISSPVLQDPSSDNSNGKLDPKRRCNSDSIPTTGNGSTVV